MAEEEDFTKALQILAKDDDVSRQLRGYAVAYGCANYIFTYPVVNWFEGPFHKVRLLKQLGVEHAFYKDNGLTA